MSCSELAWDCYVIKNYHVSGVGHVDIEFVGRVGRCVDDDLPTWRAQAQVRALSQSRNGVVAEGTQASLPLQELLVFQVSADCRTTKSDGRSGRLEATTSRRRCCGARSAADTAGGASATLGY